MFINFTNHPSHLCDEKQIQESLKYGNIKDIPFPFIDPNLSTDDIIQLAHQCLDEILKYEPQVVLVQGEMTLNYHVVRLLKDNHIKVVCACSKRQAQERKDDNGRVIKESIFQFVKYREY